MRVYKIFFILISLIGWITTAGCQAAPEPTTEITVQAPNRSPAASIPTPTGKLPPTNTPPPTAPNEPPSAPSATATPALFSLHKDIPYLVIDGVNILLDIAVPTTGDGPFPIVVFIHGGGWKLGSKHQFQKQIQWAAERGYVGVSIDYRLVRIQARTPTNGFPAQIHDSKCAVQWLRANAETYQIDPNRLGTVGASAGGHLSLMLALTDSADGLDGNCGLNFPSEVQAAVNIAGPVQLKDKSPNGAINELTINFVGGTLEENPEKYAAASPITYVSDNDPPILSILGTADKITLLSQGELLDAAVAAVGGDHELIILEGKNHDQLVAVSPEVFDIIFTFFDQHLK